MYDMVAVRYLNACVCVWACVCIYYCLCWYLAIYHTLALPTSNNIHTHTRIYYEQPTT